MHTLQVGDFKKGKVSAELSFKTLPLARAGKFDPVGSGGKRVRMCACIRLCARGYPGGVNPIVLTRVTLPPHTRAHTIPGTEPCDHPGCRCPQHVHTRTQNHTLTRTHARAQVRLAFFADVAVTANSSDTVRGLAAAKPDLALLLGDFSYANMWVRPWGACVCVFHVQCIPGTGRGMGDVRELVSVGPRAVP